MLEDILKHLSRRTDLQDRVGNCAQEQLEALEQELAKPGYWTGDLSTQASYAVFRRTFTKQIFLDIVLHKRVEAILEQYKKIEPEKRPRLDYYIRDTNLETGKLEFFKGTAHNKIWKHWAHRGRGKRPNFIDWCFAISPDAELQDWHSKTFVQGHPATTEQWKNIFITSYIRNVMEHNRPITLEKFAQQYDLNLGTNIERKSRSSIYGHWWQYCQDEGSFIDWVTAELPKDAAKSVTQYGGNLLPNRKLYRVAASKRETSSKEDAIKRLNAYETSGTTMPFEDYFNYRNPETGQIEDQPKAQKFYLEWYDLHSGMHPDFLEYVRHLRSPKTEITQRLKPTQPFNTHTH